MPFNVIIDKIIGKLRPSIVDDNSGLSASVLAAPTAVPDATTGLVVINLNYVWDAGTSTWVPMTQP